MQFRIGDGELLKMMPHRTVDGVLIKKNGTEDIM
jgi:hypothetical protein